MNGYVNLLKPPGMSSAAAVAFVKRLVREKTGHAGTLDPAVAGVLPIMVGRATRLQQYFTDKTKAYIGEICFTGSTDTQDAQGVQTEAGRGVPDRNMLEAVIRNRFIGDILQVPPMYSAVKRGGTPLYALARAGKTADIEARQTRIDACEILSSPDEYTYRLRIDCAGGTYIRTLMHDIGQALGMPAHMRMLIRTRSGCFRLENSVTAEKLQEAADAGRLKACLMSMEEPLTGYPRIDLSERLIMPARNGVTVPIEGMSKASDSLAAVYASGTFFGIGRLSAGSLKMCFIADP